MGHIIKVPGYVIGKDGKLIKRPIYRDVSAKIRAGKSKRQKVVKRGVA